MISRQFIAELSTKYQTSEQNIAREYCQHLFLSYLYKRKESEKLLFKGGTALRIIFGSPRFSEDLDFSGYNFSIEEINSLIDLVLIDMSKEGINFQKEVNPGTAGETSGGYYAIVELKLLEFDSEIRIQISLRDKKGLKSNTQLVENDFIAPYAIVFLEEGILVREKIQALLERAKSRDFFDLYFILRSRCLIGYVPQDISNLKEKIMEALQNGWEKELKIFLPASYHPLLKNFKERLMREIEIHIKG
ncbi:nucleotidyl transferase AbiEii/AbiGii toxin family protein [Patescibacteria group bacterium]|nr:nucleotidyl transferase AbiEii/AbiGii toxin family protein [Patescibacteria group bacterium]